MQSIDLNQLVFRKARMEDLQQIVEMLADDILGKKREEIAEPLPDFYLEAFHQINQSSDNFLLTTDYQNFKNIATMQLTFIPCLVRKGAKRMNIEALRVHKDFRGKKIGEKMMEFAFAEARSRNCKILQFSTDKERIEAHKFYTRLGFESSHLGFKKFL